MDDFLKEITKENWRVVRIDANSENESQYDNLKEWLDTFSKYVLGIERVPKLHYHIVLYSDKPLDVFGAQSNKLKTCIKNLFDVQASQFSTSSVRSSVRKAIMYSVKELECIHKGIENIEDLKTQSSLKFKKKEYSEKLEELENQFYDKKLTLEEFSEKFRYMKIIQYNQTPNPPVENKYIAKHAMRRDKAFFKKYCTRQMSEVYRLLDEVNSDLYF